MKAVSSMLDLGCINSENQLIPEFCTSPPEADKSEAYLFLLIFMQYSGNKKRDCWSCAISDSNLQIGLLTNGPFSGILQQILLGVWFGFLHANISN